VTDHGHPQERVPLTPNCEGISLSIAVISSLSPGNKIKMSENFAARPDFIYSSDGYPECQPGGFEIGRRCRENSDPGHTALFLITPTELLQSNFR
jgi:hypothetical protein